MDQLLPRDRAFRWSDARAWGISQRDLHKLVEAGLVRVLFKGVYARYDVQLTVERRAEVLASALPPNAVACDETASWLHGVDLFPGFGHDGLPRLQFFQNAPHHRLRNRAVESGSRQLAPHDVVVIHGVTATSPLRTAIDLARLRKGPRALAALDGLLRVGDFTKDELIAELARFKGFRGIVQARELAPRSDERTDSPAEAWLRFPWIMASDLPQPTPQLPVRNPFSAYDWYLDLAVEELRYAAEYDGVAFHNSDVQRENDRRKRDYLREQEGWTIDVFTKEEVFARNADPLVVIRQGIAKARKQLAVPPPEFRWPSATVASRPWGR